MLKILIIEDDINICSEYRKTIGNSNSLSLVNITNSSSKGLKYLKENNPDVVILDLELHKGSGSGIEFLQGIKAATTVYVPYIIVATNNTSSVTLEFVRSLGADYIFSKYEEDFSVDKVLNFIISLSNVIQSKHSISVFEDDSVSVKSTDKQIHSFLSTTLNKIGILPKLKGHDYLIKAIMMVANDCGCNYTEIIAKEVKKSIPSVERAMQNAIKQAWTKTDIDTLQKYYSGHFSFNQSCPTLKEFVFYYADYIKHTIQ